MLRRVTQPPHIAGPLGNIGGFLHVIKVMKVSSNILRAVLLIGSLVLFSCEKPDITDDPLFAEQLLINSVDTILVDSHRYFLETELSRNLMPGGPIPTKRKLRALISLVNADSLSISENISISKLYVVNGTLIWTSVPHESSSSNIPEYKLFRVSTDGPEWATDILVDVVAEIFDNQTKQKHLIKKLDQKIEAAY